MRLPRLKFTVRMLMVMVAIVAVAFGAEKSRRRWVLYRMKTAAYARMEAGLLQAANREEAEADALRRRAEKKREEAERDKAYPQLQRNWLDIAREETMYARMKSEEAESDRRRATFYGRLKEKYKRAANRPWESVEPDPEEPDL